MDFSRSCDGMLIFVRVPRSAPPGKMVLNDQEWKELLDYITDHPEDYARILEDTADYRGPSEDAGE